MERLALDRIEHDLQLFRIETELLKSILPSFGFLPRTNHADGQYRLRRYSVVNLLNGKVQPSDKHEFMQSSDINHFQGDVVRQFERDRKRSIRQCWIADYVPNFCSIQPVT